MVGMTMPTNDHPLSGLAGRRAFLRFGGLTVIGLAGAACSNSASPAAGTAGLTASKPASTRAPAPASDSIVASTAAVAAPSGSVDTTASSPTGLSAFTAATFEGLGTCSLMPEKTAGPFPLDQQFDRRDITEGVPGQPMRFGLRVLDESCKAVPGATIEIWHADSTGDYSAFIDHGDGKDAGPGTTFLRGTQTADNDGIVEFLTIYPGWYTGRAVHVHLRVHLADATVLTSQIFFGGDYTAGVYAAAPYAQFGLPDTPNSADGIAGNPSAEGTLLHTAPGDTAKGAGTVALLNLGIDPTARSTGAAGGPGGGPPGGGPPPPQP